VRIGSVRDGAHAGDAGDLRGLRGERRGSAASTTTSMLAPAIFAAQLTHLAVLWLSWPFRCSATMRILDMVSSRVSVARRDAVALGQSGSNVKGETSIGQAVTLH
jgi:hypothetical protein